jgi:hypothetical protein
MEYESFHEDGHKFPLPIEDGMNTIASFFNESGQRPMFPISSFRIRMNKIILRPENFQIRMKWKNTFCTYCSMNHGWAKISKFVFFSEYGFGLQ